MNIKEFLEKLNEEVGDDIGKILSRIFKKVNPKNSKEAEIAQAMAKKEGISFQNFTKALLAYREGKDLTTIIYAKPSSAVSKTGKVESGKIGGYGKYKSLEDFTESELKMINPHQDVLTIFKNYNEDKEWDDYKLPNTIYSKLKQAFNLHFKNDRDYQDYIARSLESIDSEEGLPKGASLFIKQYDNFNFGIMGNKYIEVEFFPDVKGIKNASWDESPYTQALFDIKTFSFIKGGYVK